MRLLGPFYPETYTLHLLHLRHVFRVQQPVSARIPHPVSRIRL
jgi:hypothetical protein